MAFKTLKGNKYIELLSTSNKILIDQWKIHNGVQKEYDALSKTYIYNVGAKSPVAQLSLPKDKKRKLDLYYPLLVLQLCFPVNANILFDIGVTSYNSQRKRITLSSNQKSQQNSTLFCVLPFVIDNFNCWIHVLVDVEEIVSTQWNEFKGIDFLSLSGVFRLKRIFLLSRDLTDFSEGTCIIKYDELPKQMLLPKNISQFFKYVSSNLQGASSTECLKESKIGNRSRYNNSSNASTIKSSGNSSRSSLDSRRLCVSKMKTVTLSEETTDPAFRLLSTQNDIQNHLHEAFEEEFDLNLSTLTFSETSKLENLSEFNSDSISLKINEECNSGENVIHTNAQKVELWKSLYCNEKTNDNISN